MPFARQGRVRRGEGAPHYGVDLMPFAQQGRLVHGQAVARAEHLVLAEAGRSQQRAGGGELGREIDGGILSRTHTAYDNAVFTPCETIWALHNHEEEHEEGEEHAEGEEEHEHGEDKTVCAVLVRSKSIADYSALTAAYSESSDYLVINPNTVLREVLENVDMSRKIVYILCLVILIMNVFVITLIALLSAYDSRGEISLMRLIGVSMGRINLLYLIQNAVAGAIALALALLAAHGCLLGIRSFVASMGIVLNAAKIYPVEWAILLLVFVISILPTSIMTLRMSRQDSIDR